MSINVAWIGCEQMGCTNGLVIDGRHVRNFEGREWLCGEHEEPRR